MPTDLDELMSLDPLSLSDRDLDAIIAYHRNARAESGKGKAKPKSNVDLSALVRGIAAKGTQAEPEAPRPTTGGIRRI